MAAQVAGDFIHRLAHAFRLPARLVCPSDEADKAVIEAVTRAATARGIVAMYGRRPPSGWTPSRGDSACWKTKQPMTAPFRRY